MNFAFQQGRTSEKEEKAIITAAIMRPELGITYKFFRRASEVPPDFIPAGTIDWVQGILGAVAPDYYPEFCVAHLHRRVWRAEKWPMVSGLFVKPADKPKRFDARITTGTFKGKKKPPYWISEPVAFIQEWRYYFVNSEQVYAGWYSGVNDDEPPPILQDLTLPPGWHGVLDFGRLTTGELALVEAGEPYSVGWYGHLAEGDIYARFLAEGWKYLTNTLLT